MPLHKATLFPYHIRKPLDKLFYYFNKDLITKALATELTMKYADTDFENGAPNKELRCEHT